MGRFCSACSYDSGSKLEIDANNTCSCSIAQNSLDDDDDKEGTTCSVRLQIPSLRGDPTAAEGSRGSSGSGSREHVIISPNMASEDARHRIKDHHHRRELPLYQQLLQSGNSYFQGTPGRDEWTRESIRSVMDERITLGNSEGSQSAQSQGTQLFRWRMDEASGCGGGGDRDIAALQTIKRPRPNHPKSIIRESQQQQESWSSHSRSRSLQETQAAEPSKFSTDRDKNPNPDAVRELGFAGGKRGRDEESEGQGKGITMTVVEHDSTGGNDDDSLSSNPLVRRWLHELVTGYIPRMAERLRDAPDSFHETLKLGLREVLGSSERKSEFVRLQRNLQHRQPRFTTDALLRCHRTQLEILAALKTGIAAYLHPDNPVTNTALTEILQGTRCRNISCQSSLPADDCECTVCCSTTAKRGFCNACMCVVCSKFDFNSNTCHWIGCDFCLHWCHADCGIQAGHISSAAMRSRRSTERTTNGSSESHEEDDLKTMQFRCAGCGQTSELYGFVEEVFIACANEWPMDALAKELQCVRRIFHRSEDSRGQQLFRKAEQMLVKLDSSRDVEAVWQSMMKFFATVRKEAVSGAHEVTPAVPQLPPEGTELVDGSADDLSLVEEKERREALQFGESEGAEELARQRARQKAQLKELESILQIKEAEAKTYQMRADEVRSEADGLQRIVKEKIAKFDEEYRLNLIKLGASAILMRRDRLRT